MDDPAKRNPPTKPPETLDDVPADAVAVVAAYAGFFDRAKLAVCGKLISQACAKVTSELLIVHRTPFGDTREVYIGDHSLWRRCADPPIKLWTPGHAVCINGRMCVVSDDLTDNKHLCAQVSIYDPKRDEWFSEGGVKELDEHGGYVFEYGCCAFDGKLVLVGGESKDGSQSPLSRVLKVDPDSLATELPRRFRRVRNCMRR